MTDRSAKKIALLAVRRRLGAAEDAAFRYLMEYGDSFTLKDAATKAERWLKLEGFGPLSSRVQAVAASLDTLFGLAPGDQIEDDD